MNEKLEFRWRQAIQNPHQHSIPHVSEIHSNGTHTRYMSPAYEKSAIVFADGTCKVLQFRMVIEDLQGSATQWQDVPIQEPNS